MWAAAAILVTLLDGHADRGSLALPLVLAAAACGMWWPMRWLLPACLVATLAFNWLFIEPRGTFHVTLQRDALLLLAMLGTSLGTAWLSARQARISQLAQEQAQRIRQLHELSGRLRSDEDPWASGARLMQAAAEMGFGQTALALLAETHPGAPQALAAATFRGDLNDEERAGLRHCMAEGNAFGPGTGRHDNQPSWYLPLKGQAGILGAALFRLPAGGPHPQDARQQLEAMCNLVGQSIERMQSQLAAAQARQRAQDEAIRNTFLAAVSHDYRTPLATIMGAASSLHDQQARLSSAQQMELAGIILDEVQHLSRVTDNALQLTRLDAPQVTLSMDWESPEELVGAVLARVKARMPQRRIEAHLAPALPLLRCDAVLIVQLLDNLLDNALRYSPPEAAVQVSGAVDGATLLLRVQDEGPGIADEDRERIFDAFQRASTDEGLHSLNRRGTGLGLALCRAVAQAHGGTLRHRHREDGRHGSCFELRLPLQAPPVVPEPT